MPRNVTTSFRRSAEASFYDEVDLIFLTISHPELSDDIRVVWDTQDHDLDGLTHIGFPFDIEILSDDENPPKAQLAIQNVDPIIGQTIRTLTSPPRVRIDFIYSGSSAGAIANILDESSATILDESSAVITDVTTGFSTEDTVYTADKLYLINITVDVLTVSGTLQGWDYQQRVWPGPRAMQLVFPGLFR